MFRQFALVIASTAIISALNALTLKPTQCALYLKPRPKDYKINWFYRGFNTGYEAVENVYIGLVSRMAHHPLRWRASSSSWSARPGLSFRDYPTHVVAARRSGLLHRDCAASRRAPRSPACARSATQSTHVLGTIAGIKGWVTIGGYSALDTAKLSNVITVFVVYRRLGQAPAGLLPDDADCRTDQKIQRGPIGDSLRCCRLLRFPDWATRSASR